MFKLKRLPHSEAELASSATRNILYCETAQYTRPEITAIIQSCGLGMECVCIDDIVSARYATALEYEIVLVPIYGSRVPDSVYALCRRIRSAPCPLWRMEPTVLLMVFKKLPDEVDADLRDLGCDLVFAPNAPQLALKLQSEKAYRARLRRRGVLIERITPVDWKLIGPHGSGTFYLRNLRERKIVTELMSDRRGFDMVDLAIAAGCEEDQVKVLIDRIRKRYDKVRKPLGICIPRTMFIETVDEAHGYRLLATIRNKPRQ